MKHYVFLTCMSFILALTSCYRDSEDVVSVNDKYVTFNFNLAGVEHSSLTRAISEPSNLLIIDKFGDEVTSDTKTSLAPFSLPLEYGRHEIYFVADELKKDFPALTFTQISYCAGILSIFTQT